MKIRNGKVIIAAIAGLVIIEAIALLKGIDGALFSLVAAIIGGLAGWSFPQPRFLKQ